MTGAASAVLVKPMANIAKVAAARGVGMEVLIKFGIFIFLDSDSDSDLRLGWGYWRQGSRRISGWWARMAGCGVYGVKKVFDLDFVCFWKSPARREH
jgi:hypothetical protein